MFVTSSLTFAHRHQPATLYISWSAPTNQAARIALFISRASLHVLGAGAVGPDHLEHPWQLRVHLAQEVHGLPACQSTHGYLVQDAAARAAGW